MNFHFLLQIWFSSCWDENTLKAFQTVLQDALSDIDKYQLDEADVPLLKKWENASISVSDAKQKFAVEIVDTDLQNILGMALKEDQLKFCRYFFTGIIFVDESRVVCGNPTMFTSYQGCTKTPNEIFLRALNPNRLELLDRFINIGDGANCLYDYIQLSTYVKISFFIRQPNIVCHFHTKSVNLKDFKLAAEFRKLKNVVVINWSNIPDFVPRKDFIKFIKACSTNRSHLHHVKFSNWQKYVFGSSHIDWVSHKLLYFTLSNLQTTAPGYVIESYGITIYLAIFSKRSMA